MRYAFTALQKSGTSARLQMSVCGMATAFVALAAWSACADASTPSTQEAGCAALMTEDFSQLPDGPAQILSSRFISGEMGSASYCDIHGYSWRNIQFRVLIPVTAWNEKMVVLGTGGQAGQLSLNKPDDWTADILARGFAVVLNNSGHVSSGFDSKWGWNNEVAMIDYGFRASHVAGAVGRAVVAAFTGKMPAKSYFHGCSNGGREALMMAQRYPQDYDGIVALDPSQAYGKLFIHMAWFMDLLRDQGQEGMTPAAASVLHANVLSQCDAVDGAKDGLLDDPRRCKVDFNKMQCRPGMTASCLTPHQIEIARKLYEGPRSSGGTQLAMSSILPGSELHWHVWLKALNVETAEDMRDEVNHSNLIENYPREVFRYLMTSPGRGPTFEPKMSELSEYRKQMSYMDALLSATDPDLRQYRDNGGKLLVAWGWNDALGGTLQGIDYFEAVQRVMGGDAATASFARMFMVPGMGHCRGGEGPWNIDYLSALDTWVTKGTAPDYLVGTHPADESGPEFSRQIPRFRTRSSSGTN